MQRIKFLSSYFASANDARTLGIAFWSFLSCASMLAMRIHARLRNAIALLAGDARSSLLGFMRTSQIAQSHVS
jgi:hypothetical protein